MAQTGFTPLSLYYSATATNVPLAANLVAGELALNTADGKLFYKDSSGVVQLLASSSGASGNVVGPASSTDNAISRFDGTTGKLIQNSVVTIADTTGNMAGVGTLGVGAITTSGALVGAVSQDAFNTVSTTLNLGGAATTVNIGAATGTLTVANATLAAKALTATAITNSALTATRLVYSGTAGLEVDSANLTFNGTDLTVSGAVNAGSINATTLDLTNLEVTNIKAKDGTASIALADTTGIATFSKATVISTTDNTNAALHITQLGTGNALLVEDSTNPDSTPFVINNAGNTFIGYGTSLAPAAVSGSDLQVNALGSTQANITASQWTATGSGSAQILLTRSISGVRGTQTIVTSGTALGKIRSFGSDGTNFIEAASIESFVDGTPGTNDMPGRLTFSTTADGASSPTERMRIDSAGGVGIGGTSIAAGYTLSITRAMTGAATAYGVIEQGAIQTDVTAAARYFSSFANGAASLTTGALSHFYAQSGSLGAGSAVTSQYGFVADSSLTGATNNYGFYSNIASGANRYNFYANGTATNFFAGNTIFSVTDNTNAALRITQLGTGNALLVEDSTNPDSTPFVVDASGKVAIGATTAAENLNLVSDGRNFFQITRASTDASQSVIAFRKARGTNAAPTIIANSDIIGDTQFYGYDGVGYVQAATIFGAVDGTPGVNDMPGRLVFATTADGASSLTERMRIDSAGNVGIGAVPTSAAKANITSTSAGASTIALSLQNASNTINSETVLDFVTNTQGAGVRSAQITAINTNGGTGVNMLFKIGNGAVATEAMRITSLGGLQIQTGVGVGAATPGASGVAFPATAIAVADANTLDDYEEGSWTPVVTFTGGNGDLTTAVALGVYTKIGRLVQIAFNVEFTETTALTNLTITGVPFTSGSTVTVNVGCFVDNMTTIVGSPVIQLGTSTTTIGLRQTQTGSEAAITNVNTGTSSRVRGSLSYSI